MLKNPKLQPLADEFKENTASPVRLARIAQLEHLYSMHYDRHELSPFDDGAADFEIFLTEYAAINGVI